MPRIDLEVAQHQLNIFPEAHPVKQKPRKFALDRHKAISDEVDRLMEAGFITQVNYPQWPSNVILIRKFNES